MHLDHRTTKTTACNEVDSEATDTDEKDKDDSGKDDGNGYADCSGHLLAEVTAATARRYGRPRIYPTRQNIIHNCINTR